MAIGGGFHRGAAAAESLSLATAPAVTLVRSLGNSFAGIEPNMAAFIAAQLAGAAAAIVLFRWFYRREDVATRSTGR